MKLDYADLMATWLVPGLTFIILKHIALIALIVLY